LGLIEQPAQQNYFGYNLDHITTDFEYMDLASTFGSGWELDTKVYTYGYYHRGFNGEDPNGQGPQAFPDLVVPTYGGSPQFGVPGELLQNDYRSVGTITRVTKDLPIGDVKFGIWYDHSSMSARSAKWTCRMGSRRTLIPSMAAAHS